jgi:hypothetical protein
LRVTAEVDEQDVYFPRAVIGNAVIGFNREGGEFVDEDADDGLALYFNAISVSVTPGQALLDPHHVEANRYAE